MDKKANPIPSHSNGKNFSINFEPNILDMYDSPTYHFRLFMAPEQLTKKREFGTINDQITIAESGVTGIGIDEVTIKSVHGLSASVNGSSTSITTNIRLKEPFNAMLFDKMYEASLMLGIKNYHKCPYFLEVTFLGNDRDSGRPVVIGDRKWVLPLQIIGIATELTAAGTTYDIEAARYSDLASTDQESVLKQNVSVNIDEYIGKTISDAFFDISNTITNAFSKSPNALNNVYEIRLDRSNDGVLRVKSLKDDEVLVKENDESKRNEDIAFTDGTSIERMIDAVMASSKSLQEAAKSSIERTENLADKQDKQDIIIKKLYKIHTDVEILDYDPILGDYSRKYTYIITDYGAASITACPEEVALIPSISQPAIDTFIYEGSLRKHYNYLYSGQNTDIKNFDLKFNMAWYVALPRNNGKYGSMTKDDASKFFTSDQQIQYDEYQETIKKYESELTAKQERVDKLQSEINQLNTENKDTRRTKLELDAEKSQIDFIDDKLARVNRESKQLINSSLNRKFEGDVNTIKPDGKMYIEDLTPFQDRDTGNNQDRKNPISFKIDPVNDSQSGLGNREIDSGKTFFSALFAQANKTATSDMIACEFTIKGDPFWLPPPMEFNSTKELTTINNIENQHENKRPQYNCATYLMENYLLFTTYSPDENAIFEQNRSSMGKKNIMNGVFAVISSEHSFTAGEFTQKLETVRVLISDLNYVQLENYISGEVSQAEIEQNMQQIQMEKDNKLKIENAIDQEIKQNKELTSIRRELSKTLDSQRRKVLFQQTKQIENRIKDDVNARYSKTEQPSNITRT